ncbi:unnamed protein product [Heterobilharzia americana]|nr:unnamed protein product [Heterobilharzia americana]
MFVNQFKQCVDSMKNQVPSELNGSSGIRVPSDSLNLTSDSLQIPIQNGSGVVNPSSATLTSTCMNSITHSTLQNLPSSQQHINSTPLPTVQGVVPTATTTTTTNHATSASLPAQNDVYSNNQSVQNQLKSAQAQVRRLEAEISHLKRYAMPVMGGSLNGGSSYPTNYPNIEPGVPMDADIPDLRCGIGRLDLDGLNGGGVNNNGEWINELSINNKPKPVGTIHPSLVQGNQNRPIWIDRASQDTIRSLHTRLGNVLKEALEIHNRLGSLLSSPSVE